MVSHYCMSALLSPSCLPYVPLTGCTDGHSSTLKLHKLNHKTLLMLCFLCPVKSATVCGAGRAGPVPAETTLLIDGQPPSTHGGVTGAPGLPLSPFCCPHPLITARPVRRPSRCPWATASLLSPVCPAVPVLRMPCSALLPFLEAPCHPRSHGSGPLLCPAPHFSGQGS